MKGKGGKYEDDVIKCGMSFKTVWLKKWCMFFKLESALCKDVLSGVYILLTENRRFGWKEINIIDNFVGGY